MSKQLVNTDVKITTPFIGRITAVDVHLSKFLQISSDVFTEWRMSRWQL